MLLRSFKTYILQQEYCKKKKNYKTSVIYRVYFKVETAHEIKQIGAMSLERSQKTQCQGARAKVVELTACGIETGLHRNH